MNPYILFLLSFNFFLTSSSTLQALNCNSLAFVQSPISCALEYNNTDFVNDTVIILNDQNKTIVVFQTNQSFQFFNFFVTFNSSGIKTLTAVSLLNQSIKTSLDVYNQPTIDYFYCDKSVLVNTNLTCFSSITAEISGVPFRYFYYIGNSYYTLSKRKTNDTTYVNNITILRTIPSVIKLGVSIDLLNGASKFQAVKFYTENSITFNVPSIYTGISFNLSLNLTTTWSKFTQIKIDYDNWMSEIITLNSIFTVKLGPSDLSLVKYSFDTTKNILILSSEATEDVYIDSVVLYSSTVNYINLRIIKFLNCGFYDGSTCKSAILSSKSNIINSENIRVVNSWSFLLQPGMNILTLGSVRYEIGSFFLITKQTQQFYNSYLAFKATSYIGYADFQLANDFESGDFLFDGSYYYMIAFIVNAEKFFKTYSVISSPVFYRLSGYYNITACDNSFSFCRSQFISVTDDLSYKAVCSANNCTYNNKMCTLEANENINCSINVKTLDSSNVSINYNDNSYDSIGNNLVDSTFLSSVKILNFKQDSNQSVDFTTDKWFVLISNIFEKDALIHGLEIVAIKNGSIYLKVFDYYKVVNATNPQIEFDSYPSFTIKLNIGYNMYSFNSSIKVSNGSLIAFKYLDSAQIAYGSNFSYGDFYFTNNNFSRIDSFKNIRFCLRPLNLKSFYFKTLTNVSHSYSKSGVYKLEVTLTTSKSIYSVGSFQFKIKEPNLVLSTNFSNYLNENPNKVIDILSDSTQDLTGCMSDCSHNGVCNIQNNTYKCQCNKYYSGNMCQFDLRACSRQPCINEAVCVQDEDNYSKYVCNCTEYYYGVNCELKIDICANFTCSFNGFCVDEFKKPKCKCFSMYEGENCEIKLAKLVTIQAIVSTTSIVAIITIVLFFLTFVFLDILDWYTYYNDKKNKIQNN